MSATAVIATLAPAYLLGAMPWSLWVARARGIDLRRVGSGNLGATNVYRQFGPGLGISVLLLDVGKGSAAALWGASSPWAEAFPGAATWAGLAAGLAAILGHVFTPFAGFRGGKGVATTVGAFLALAPLAMGIALAIFTATLFWSRRVSLGSLAMAVALPFLLAATATADLRSPLVALATLSSALVIFRHRANIRRLRAGTEPPFAIRRGGEPTGSPGNPPKGRQA